MCCCIQDSKGIARCIVRAGLGLALAFVGFAHYRDPLFAVQASQDLGMLAPLGVVWGYVLPGLMIFGGVLLAFGIYLHIAAYATALALISIPFGLALKSAIGGIPLEETMSATTNAFLWIVVFLMTLKGGCCALPSMAMEKPMAKPVVKPASKPAPVKSVQAAPAAILKTPPKKAPAKKPLPQKKSSSAGLKSF